MLGFAPIASVPLSALSQQVVYPFTLTNINYLYNLSIGVGPVSISVPTIPSASTVYEITAGLGLIFLYPDFIQNVNIVYGAATYVFDRPPTTFKTNIVTVKEPYNIIVNAKTDKFIKTSVLIID